jgi:hypothetical protein
MRRSVTSPDILSPMTGGPNAKKARRMGERASAQPEVPLRVARGPYAGQPIRPMSPDRSERLGRALKQEFPEGGAKLPLDTDVAGRTMELAQMDYLARPRKGGKARRVLDPNATTGRNFPAVDAFAVPEEGGELELYQSKAHFQPTVEGRASALKSDLSAQPAKGETLAKRVHPDEASTWKKYGEPLHEAIEALGPTTGGDADLFGRATEGEDYDAYLDDVDRRRGDLAQRFEGGVFFPTSPRTADAMDDPWVVSMPVHTADVQRLASTIPSRQRSAPKPKVDAEWVPSLDSGSDSED